MSLPNFFSLRLTADQQTVAVQMFRKRRKGVRIKLKCPFCRERIVEGDVFCCDDMRDTVKFILEKCPAKSQNVH